MAQGYLLDDSQQESGNMPLGGHLGPAVGDGLLLEAAGVSTDFILLEDNSFILQES